MKIKLNKKVYLRGEEYSVFKGLYNSLGEKIYETIRDDLIAFKYVEEDSGLIYNTQLGVRIIYDDNKFDSVDFNKDDTLEYFTYSNVEGDIDCDYFDNLEQIIINHAESDLMSHADYEL